MLKSLDQFAAAFPFDLVAVLSSLARAIDDNIPGAILKLMSDARSKATLALSLLDKYDKSLWKAEGSMSNPVQLRGPLKRYLDQIVSATSKDAAPGGVPVPLNDNEIQQVADDPLIDAIYDLFGAYPPKGLTELGVLRRKQTRLRALIGEQDPAAAEVAAELRPAIERTSRNFKDYVRNELNDRITLATDLYAVSERDDVKEILNEVQALRNQNDPFKVYAELLKGGARKLGMILGAVATAQPGQVFEQCTSTSARLTAGNWDEFIATLPDSVRDSHQTAFDRISERLAEFEQYQQNIKANLLNPAEIAKESKCLNRLVQQLKSLHTGEQSLSERAAAMLEEIRSFVKRYNDRVASGITVDAVWNLDGGKEYLIAEAVKDDADDNVPFFKDAKAVEAQVNDDDPEATAKVLKAFVDRHKTDQKSNNDQYLTVNVAHSAMTNLKKGREILDKLPGPDDDNREKQVRLAIKKILRGLRTAVKDLGANLGDVLSRRKADFVLDVDL